MGERRFSARLPRFGQTDCALEKLPVRVDERDERDRSFEQPRRQPREAIEGLLRRRVEQPTALDGREPVQIANDGKQVRHSERIIAPRPVVRKSLCATKGAADISSGSISNETWELSDKLAYAHPSGSAGGLRRAFTSLVIKWRRACGGPYPGRALRDCLDHRLRRYGRGLPRAAHASAR